MLIKLILVLLVAFFALRSFMPRIGNSAAIGAAQINGENRLADCPTTPNCQCSESTRSEQRVDRLPVNGNAGEAIQTLATLINTQPGMLVVTQDDRYLHATATSKVMRYVDDIEFLVSDDDQSVQIRSASRLGKSDLGANAKRVSTLQALLAGKL